MPLAARVAIWRVRAMRRLFAELPTKRPALTSFYSLSPRLRSQPPLTTSCGEPKEDRIRPSGVAHIEE
eukprot:4699023-Pyramimonas_sp.AAC.2